MVKSVHRSPPMSPATLVCEQFDATAPGRRRSPGASIWAKLEPMSDRDDELGIEETSGLTDADWAEINKLRRAYDSGRDKELVKAWEIFAQDPVRAVRVLGAFFPDKMRETLKDMMAEMGMTIEDFREILEKSERPPTKQ